MLSCLQPVLVIAAGLSLRSPFVEPFDKRDEARAARKRFAGALRSDHLAILHAYEAFRRASARGAAAARELCRTHFLSFETLTQMDQVMGRVCVTGVPRRVAECPCWEKEPSAAPESPRLPQEVPSRSEERCHLARG